MDHALRVERDHVQRAWRLPAPARGPARGGAAAHRRRRRRAPRRPQRADHRGDRAPDRRGRHRRGAGPLAADVRGALRRLPFLLRPQPGHRRARRVRRGGRHHRRPVDRRAGHAADDANVPHRRCGGPRHHGRPAARRGAVRGPRPQGQGRDQPHRRHRGDPPRRGPDQGQGHVTRVVRHVDPGAGERRAPGGAGRRGGDSTRSSREPRARMARQGPR